MRIFIALLLCASTAHGACDTARALETLRPGAEWVVRGEDITWLDKVQTRPTSRQINDAITACISEETLTKQAREQALIDLKNSSITDRQKLEALIKYLGL